MLAMVAMLALLNQPSRGWRRSKPVAHRYPSADRFLCGFWLRVHGEKHRNAGRLGIISSRTKHQIPIIVVDHGKYVHRYGKSGGPQTRWSALRLHSWTQACSHCGGCWEEPGSVGGAYIAVDVCDWGYGLATWRARSSGKAPLLGALVAARAKIRQFHTAPPGGLPSSTLRRPSTLWRSVRRGAAQNRPHTKVGSPTGAAAAMGYTTSPATRALAFSHGVAWSFSPWLARYGLRDLTRYAGSGLQPRSGVVI